MNETGTVEWKQSACIVCECNCGVEIRLGGDDGRRFDRIRGDRAHPASEGYTCEKALRLDHYQNGTHRLTSSLRTPLPTAAVSSVDADRYGVVHGGFAVGAVA